MLTTDLPVIFRRIHLSRKACREDFPLTAHLEFGMHTPSPSQTLGRRKAGCFDLDLGPCLKLGI